jgi:hypothetical protein
MQSKFDKTTEFSLEELGYEIGKNIITKNFIVEYNTKGSDDILFKTDDSRYDVYKSVIGYVKYLGFTTQPLRDSKPEFKIPKSTLRFKTKDGRLITRKRNINIKVLPKSGKTYLQSGWENPLIYDLKRYYKLPREMARTNPDNYAEYLVLRQFNQLVDETPVAVTIGSKKFDSIAGMIPGPPGAKADFVAIDINGKPKFYISHKEGSDADDFQQYSGISRRGAGKKIADHKAVKKFVEALDSREELFTEETAYWRDIGSTKLKQYAVFGKDFDNGPSNPGVNNVDFFAQGNIILHSDTNTRRVYVRFSKVLIARKDLYRIFRGDYNPTLGARKGETSRKVGRHNGVRGGIWSSKYIKDRSSTEI